MIEFHYTVDNSDTVTHFPESPLDIEAFWQWFATTGPIVAADIESTSLKVFSRSFKVRLVQFGDERHGWVLRADRFAPDIRRVLASGKRFAFHNGFGFDVPALCFHGFADLEDLAPRIIDTRLIAHLIDPRPAYQGGQGLSLKQLADVLVDPTAPDTSEDLKAVFKNDLKVTIKSGLGWSLIPIDHPTYVLYAGLDVILLARVLKELSYVLAGLKEGQSLARKEHKLAHVVSRMHIRGMLIDVPYTEKLVYTLDKERADQAERALRYGVQNVNSPKQVREALTAMGERWDEQTDGGELSVSGDVLRPMADLDKSWTRVNYREPNYLADAVLRSKRANKWRESYAIPLLEDRDSNDRVHPMISTLQARTARMAVSRPPLQQLPSSDGKIRRAFYAPEGWAQFGVDYAQVEMRVLAAMAGVEKMKEMILYPEFDSKGKPLGIHKMTAKLLFGENYPEWKYKIAKNTGFCKVYGGGIRKIAQTSGVPFDEAKVVADAYDAAYPEIKTFGRRLQQRAEYGRKEVITPSGRRLPLDRDRLYAATNYVVQSTARDLLAEGIIRIAEAGLDKYLLLPVHDELIGEAPASDAPEIMEEIRKLMESVFMGVPIEAEGEIFGRSWGGGYHMPYEENAA